MTEQNTTEDQTKDTQDVRTPEAEEVQDTHPPAPTEDTDPDPQDAPEEDAPTPGKEAAKYRRRLRETESERDTLREQVQQLQRAEVDRQAEAARLSPAALWASGAELSNLLTEAGTVDSDAVLAAIETARTDLGIPDPRLSGGRAPREGATPRPEHTSGRAAMADIVAGR